MLCAAATAHALRPHSPLSTMSSSTALSALLCALLIVRTASSVAHSQHERTQHACSSGFPRHSSLQRYNNVTGHVPLFGDLLLSDYRVYAVINLKLVLHQGWHEAAWTFEKEGNVVQCASFGQDPHLQTLVLYADQSALGIDGTRLERVTITGRLGDSERVFDRVPLCPPPDTSSFFFVACTSTLSGAELHHLPEWIAYNHVQGMEHSYVYVNDDFAKAEAALRPFVDAGLATLVDWTPPAQHANSFLYQQAQQNSCLLRARGRVHWVALHDSDEFFYAAKPWTSVAQMLHKFVHDGVDDQIGAVQARTWFYGMHDAEAEQKERQGAVDVGSANLLLARCVARDKGPIYAGREKLIVRPEHVHYVSVHMVTLGMPTHTLDAESEMRLVHYKDVEHMRYHVTDMVMQEWVEPVQAVLDGVMMRGKG